MTALWRFDESPHDDSQTAQDDFCNDPPLTQKNGIHIIGILSAVIYGFGKTFAGTYWYAAG